MLSEIFSLVVTGGGGSPPPVAVGIRETKVSALPLVLSKTEDTASLTGVETN